MNAKGARSPDRIKAPNHPARTVRKPPKPETRGSNPRGPATFQVPASALQMRANLFLTLNYVDSGQNSGQLRDFSLFF